jgi:hypothetical protein
MTLIACRALADHVEFAADTLTMGDVDFAYASKVSVYPHLDAAVGAFGPNELGSQWRDAIERLPMAFRSFDEMHERAPAVLPQMWEQIPNRDRGARTNGGVVQAGWSDQRSRFVAYSYASGEDLPLAAVIPLALTGVADAAHGAFDLSPTSGPAGTTITVSEDEGLCAPPDTAEDPFVAVLLVDEGRNVLNLNDADLGEAGTFSLTVTVPEDTPRSAVDARSPASRATTRRRTPSSSSTDASSP